MATKVRASIRRTVPVRLPRKEKQDYRLLKTLETIRTQLHETETAVR